MQSVCSRECPHSSSPVLHSRAQCYCHLHWLYHPTYLISLSLFFFNHKVLVLSSFSDFIQFFFFLSPLTKSWPHFFNSSCLLEPPPSLAFTHTDKCQLKNLFFFFTKSYCFVTLRHISLEEVARTCCLWIQMALQQPRAVFYKLLCQRGSSILSINRVILKWSGSRTLPRS